MILRTNVRGEENSVDLAPFEDEVDRGDCVSARQQQVYSLRRYGYSFGKPALSQPELCYFFARVLPAWYYHDMDT